MRITRPGLYCFVGSFPRPPTGLATVLRILPNKYSNATVVLALSPEGIPTQYVMFNDDWEEVIL